MITHKNDLTVKGIRYVVVLYPNPLNTLQEKDVIQLSSKVNKNDIIATLNNTS